MKNPRSGVIAAFVGAFGGCAYKIWGTGLYETGKEAWLLQRRHIEQTSRYKVLRIQGHDERRTPLLNPIDKAIAKQQSSDSKSD